MCLSITALADPGLYVQSEAISVSCRLLDLYCVDFAENVSFREIWCYYDLPATMISNSALS